MFILMQLGELVELDRLKTEETIASWNRSKPSQVATEKITRNLQKV